MTFEEATFVEPVNTCLKAVRKARVAQRRDGARHRTRADRNAADDASESRRRQSSTRAIRWPGRRAASLRFGAVEAFDPQTSNLAEEMRKRTGGRGADAVLVAVPNPSLVPEALAIARPGGRVLLFAHNDPVLKLEFPAAAVGIEEKEILGSYSASVDDQEESAALVFNHRLPMREMISHRFPLERIADALELAARPADDTLKVVIAHE